MSNKNVDLFKEKATEEMLAFLDNWLIRNNELTKNNLEDFMNALH